MVPVTFWSKLQSKRRGLKTLQAPSKGGARHYKGYWQVAILPTRALILPVLNTRFKPLPPTDTNTTGDENRHRFTLSHFQLCYRH